MRIATPDALFARFVALLPKSIGDALWNVTYFIAWITLPASFLSLILDLQLVIQWAMLALKLLPDLHTIWDVAVAVVAAWRTFTQPFHDLLTQLVQISLPRAFTDLLIAGSGPVLSVLRYTLAKRAHAQQSLASHDLNIAFENAYRENRRAIRRANDGADLSLKQMKDLKLGMRPAEDAVVVASHKFVRAKQQRRSAAKLVVAATVLAVVWMLLSLLSLLLQ